MDRRLPFRWTLRRTLAALALGLGVVAIAGDPVRGPIVRLDAQELATTVASGADRVAPRELADWVVRRRTDYRLVDVRAPEAFAAYHIPTSENVPVGSLLEAGLARNERIVLVGDDGIASAQAWLLLRAQRYAGARLLDGGLAGWKEQVLHPVAPVDSTPEAMEEFARAAAVARAFGGAPRRAGREGALAAGDDDLPAPPQVTAPALPGAAGGPPPAKKKREGC